MERPLDSEPGPPEIASLLREVGEGNGAASDRLVAVLYDELKRLAGSFMSHERSDHTLQPTALVHEAFMRLSQQRNDEWKSRAQFMGLAGTAMRRVLVDHARARKAAKRGGDADPITLIDGMAVTPTGDVDVLALDEALNRLAGLDPRQSRVVEMRFFAGLSIDEVADLLGVSAPTVKRDWQHARAWLRRELTA